MITTIHTPHAPTPAGHYSQGVVHNGLVYVAGQLGIDPARAGHAPDDIELQTEITLRNVAAILVASIRLKFLTGELDLRSRGRNRIECAESFRRGEELGWFQHGSTIVLLATGGFEFDERVREGALVKMGQPLLRGLQA